ncbi:KilA-N domain-containing protein [Escherichia coli]|nr:KilA-N domain-containing protein [Escherichia coli]
MKSLTLFNQPIRIGEDGMICLTDMWKASGKSESESPYHYLRNKQTKEFLAELEKTTNLWFLRNAVRTVELMAESSLLMITQHG